MAHRVVVGKKPANKIGRLNIGEIAAVASLLRNDKEKGKMMANARKKKS
jgi:hypothetical protein